MNAKFSQNILAQTSRPCLEIEVANETTAAQVARVLNLAGNCAAEKWLVENGYEPIYNDWKVRGCWVWARGEK